MLFVALLTLTGLVLPEAAGAVTTEALIVGGAVNSQPIGSDGEMLGDGSRSGFTGGFGLLWKFTSNIGLELDGRYTQKGAVGRVDTRYAEGDSGFVVDATLHLDYIEVPLLLTGILPVGETSEVRGYIGGSANFLISSQLTGTLDGRHFDSPVENVNDIDWAAVVGVSYEYRLDTVAFVFDARFVGSLQSVEDSPDFDANVKLRAFEFTIGLGIPLGAGHF